MPVLSTPRDRPGRLLTARDVSVRDRRRTLLPGTTLRVQEGRAALVAGEPDVRHALLALALSGRLDLRTGTVDLDGDPSRATRQRLVALADVPRVNEPDGMLPVATVAAEGLAGAGLPAWPRHVRAWLRSHGLADVAGVRLDQLPLPARVRLLGTLACLARPAFVVLALPERHGGRPADWWQIATDLADGGPGVVVTASLTAADHLPVHPQLIGNGTDTPRATNTDQEFPA